MAEHVRPTDVLNADLPEDAVTAADGPRSAKVMKGTCHACDSRLTTNSTVRTPGREEATGVCPNCRLDGVGDVVFVTTDEHMPDAVQDDLDRRQQRPRAQSVTSAAAFIDRRVPAGDYTIRRVAPERLRVTADPDDPTKSPQQALSSLGARMSPAVDDTWDVKLRGGQLFLTDQMFA